MAMEHGPFEDVFPIGPIENADVYIAMLVYWSVYKTQQNPSQTYPRRRRSSSILTSTQRPNWPPGHLNHPPWLFEKNRF